MHRQTPGCRLMRRGGVSTCWAAVWLMVRPRRRGAGDNSQRNKRKGQGVAGVSLGDNPDWSVVQRDLACRPRRGLGGGGVRRLDRGVRARGRRGFVHARGRLTCLRCARFRRALLQCEIALRGSPGVAGPDELLAWPLRTTVPTGVLRLDLHLKTHERATHAVRKLGGIDLSALFVRLSCAHLQ